MTGTVSLAARMVVAGSATAPAVRLAQPLSFWGGFDAETGRVIDHHHPDVGVALTGKVVVMASGRGSSSASSVVVEAARLGTAPAGFVFSEPDEILTVGALVAADLYQTDIPIAIVAGHLLEQIQTGQPLTFGDDSLTLGSHAC